MFVPGQMCQSISASGENDSKGIYSEVIRNGLTASPSFETRQGIRERTSVPLSNAEYGIRTEVLEDGLTLITLAPIATSSQTKSAVVDMRNMGMYNTAHDLDNNNQPNQMVTGNGGMATYNAGQGLCTTAKPIPDGYCTMKSNIQSHPSVAYNGGLMMFAPAINSKSHGMNNNNQQNQMMTGNVGMATYNAGQGLCPTEKPIRDGYCTMESNIQGHPSVAYNGGLMMFAPIRNSTQTNSTMGTSTSTAINSTAHDLDNNNQQNQMVTGNGGMATYNAGQGLCTTAKPIHDGYCTMESNIQSHPSVAYNGGLMMFAPIRNSTQTNSTMGTSTSTAINSTAHDLDNNNQQNQMVTGNGGMATYNAGQGLCTTAKPIHDGYCTMESNIQSHPSVAYNGGLMMFAPIRNSTQTNSTMGTSTSTAINSTDHDLDNNNQQNQVVTGNGGIATYNAGQGLCTTAKPIHDGYCTMESNIQSHPSVAYNGGLMMSAPIWNSTMGTSASAAINSKSHDLDNNNQQNQMVTGNGGMATYNAGQGLCPTAKPIRDGYCTMKSNIQSYPSVAYNGGLMMFAPIRNSTQTNSTMETSASTAINSKSHGLDINNQQNVFTIDNCVITPTQDLHSEAQQSGLTTSSSTEDSIQSKFSIGEFTEIETWEDVCDLYNELMKTPIAVNGDIEVEICNAAQDICDDVQENGSAIVAQNLIGGDESIHLLTNNHDEDCYLGDDDDIIDIDSVECSDDVGGDLDAILGSMSLVGYEKSANNTTCNVQGRQTDAATVPAFDAASVEEDMDALKKNQSLSTSIMSRKRSDDASKKHIQASDIKGKTLPCPFCHKRVSQLARHMKGVHKTEPEILTIRSLTEEQTEERRYRLDILKKRGQFLWNSNPKNEEYIPSRRPKPGHKRDEDNFKYCPKCLGPYISSNIRHHYPKCFKGKLNGEHIALTLSKAIDGQIDARASDRLRLQIFPVLRVDNIVKLIRYDSLLIIYGNKLCIKYTPHYQENMIRARLRLVGRLLFVMKNINTEVSTLASVYNPKLYDSLIESIRVIGGYNHLTNEFKSPATASSAVTLVKQIGKILVAECIKCEDSLKQQRTENFLKLLESDVGTSILKCVTDTQARMRREKQVKIPTTDDVKLLYRYLNVERKKCFSQLKETYSYFNWLRLAEYTMASIIVFNRRRTGETQNIVVKDFEGRETLSKTSTPEFAALSEEDKKIAGAYSRLHIRGKKGRKVPVLLTPDVIECLDLLILYRTTAGVPEFNKTLFGLPSFYDKRIKVIDACMLMRKFSVLCGASDPESLRGTEMRKHMASMCIAMNLSDNLVSQVADFMGHHEDVHKAYYRINPFDTQVVKMSQVLTTALGGVDDDDDDDDENGEEGESHPDSHLDVGINGDDDHYLEDSNSQEYIDNDKRVFSPPIFSNTGTVTENQPTLTNKKPRNTNKSSQKRQHVQSLCLHSEEENDEGTQSSLSGVKFPKRRWTEDEKKAVHGAFGFYFKSQTLPSTEEIKNQQTIHKHLRSRTWEQIKTWIHNQFKTGSKAKKPKFK